MNGAVAVFERSEKKIFEFSDKSVEEYKGKIFVVFTSQQSKLIKQLISIFTKLSFLDLPLRVCGVEIFSGWEIMSRSVRLVTVFTREKSYYSFLFSRKKLILLINILLLSYSHCTDDVSLGKIRNFVLRDAPRWGERRPGAPQDTLIKPIPA